MAEKTQYVIELNDRLSPGLKKAIANATGLDKTMGKVSTKGTRGFGMLAGAVKGLVGPLALAAAGMKAFQFAGESIRAAREFEALGNAIAFASGSTEEGARNMGFIRERSNLLGTDLQATAEGFKTLSASMIGTKLEGQATRDIFDGVQVAASVMGLSAEQSKGTFLALGQIMGKGKVQAEELRGQLGERIPGAFNIAAKAMGVTTSELNKMLEQGQLIAEDFLPKFSDELKKTFGPGLEKSTQSAQANFNRFNNTMLELRLSLGKFLLPTVNKLLGGFKKFVSFLQRNKAAFLTAFAPLIDHVKEFFSIFTMLKDELAAGEGAASMFAKGLTLIKRALTFLEPLFKGIATISKTVFKGIIGLGKALFSFFDRFPIFLKAWSAFLFSIREGLLIFKDLFVGVFEGVSSLITGALSGDLSAIKQGLKTLGSTLVGTAANTGERLGDAFKEGFNKEIGLGETVKIKGAADTKGQSFDDVLKSTAGALGGPGSAAAAATAGKKASTRLDGIKSGRPTNINIDIGKLIETFNVTATNLEDINNKSKDLVAQALLSAVNNVNNIAR